MKTRHIVGVSGGKDSAALAIYLAQKRGDWRYFHDLAFKNQCLEAAKEIENSQSSPEIEYFFTDTGKELPEVYEYLTVMEKFLGKSIQRLTPFEQSADQNTSPFDHFLWAEHGGLLPSRRQRWCTYKMKIKPMNSFVAGDPTINYVGIRADESFRAKLSSLPNITSVYPFVSDQLVREDVIALLRSTTGLPRYYEWRSRSGCYFCFFQRKSEWLGLRKYHPELFKSAIQYEKDTYDPTTGRTYTWMDKISLEELDAEADKISDTDDRTIATDKEQSWQEKLLNEHLNDDNRYDHACAICSL